MWMRNLLGILFVLAGAGSALAQSLAEVAQQERARQAKVEASDKKPTYTNDDLDRFQRRDYVTTGSPPPVTPSPRAGPAKTAAGSWQRRVARADERIRALELKVEYYARRSQETPPPARNRSTRHSRLRPIRANDWEQKKAQAELELQRAREAKQQIEDEARKAGVLPGVLRGQKP